MEIYRPNPDDRLRLRVRPDMLKVSGDQVFATLQGEGVTAGKPAVFLRLHLCNLTCGLNGGWQCDTGYTWDVRREEFWKEPVDWSYQKTLEEIERAWQEKFGTSVNTDEKRLVITGGEPLLQQRKIAELIRILPGYKVEIETNGTIIPLDELSECQFNCSPKLSNSGNELSRRVRVAALKKINSLPNSWFKFVVTGPEDLDEIEDLVRQVGLDPEKIIIMPEGHTLETTTQHLALVSDEVKRRGWEVTKRNQIIWFGNKRRT